MNLKNLFKKATGLALAGALAFAGFAGSASATSPQDRPTYPTTTDSSDTDFSFDNAGAPTLTKIVEGGYFNGGTFNFELAETTAPSTYKGYQPRTSANPLISLPSNGLTITAGQNEGKLDFIINDAALQSAQVGVYRYVIKEVIPANADQISGMDYDENAYNIDIFVANEVDANGVDRKVIQNYVVTRNYDKSDSNDENVTGIDEESRNTKRSLVFTNRLVSENFTITKKITGNQANLNDKFDFTITVNTKNHSNARYSFGTTKDQPITSGTPFTITGVGNNAVIEITGLGSEDTITITEKDPRIAANDATRAKYKVTAVTDKSDDDTTETFTLTNKEDLDADGVTVNTFVLGNVVWTNDSTEDVPTGLIENLAPFILIIALAGGFAYFYFKRNKEEELA